MLYIKHSSKIFEGIDEKTDCWMSHGDSIYSIPDNFIATASTDSTRFAGVANLKKNMFGLQFHPEVVHTPKGGVMMKNFVVNVCRAKQNWTMKSFAKDAISEIKKRVGEKKVILGLSGGVDSSVTAVLIHKAIERNLICIFVDNGLLRKVELKNLKIRLKKTV